MLKPGPMSRLATPDSVSARTYLPASLDQPIHAKAHTTVTGHTRLKTVHPQRIHRTPLVDRTIQDLEKKEF
jgi:siderophore synthetase component